MRVKPGDTLYFDDDWESTYLGPDMYSIFDGLDEIEGEEMIIYKAVVVEPETYIYRNGEWVLK
jgi:hypothetical protein